MPHFAFPPSAIIKRKPLSPTARRAGWVGCNFALNRIPVEARIEAVRTVERQGRARSPSEPRRDRDIAPYQQTIIIPAAEVRAEFKRVKPLKDISVTHRDWTLDVLNVVAAVCDRRKSSGAHRAPLQDWKEFTTADPAVRDLHPRTGKAPSFFTEGNRGNKEWKKLRFLRWLLLVF